MPVEFSSHRGGTYVRLTGHGAITDDELLEAVAVMYASDENTKRHQCAMLDFSRVERADIRSETVLRIAKINVAASELVPPGASVALVASQTLVYGLGRMWEQLSNGTGWTTRTFTDIGEAERWLDQRLAT